MGQSVLGGSTTTSTPIVGSAQQGGFFNALFGSGMSGGQLQGLPSYGGPLSPNNDSTLLPSVNQQWALNNNGTNYMAGMLGANAYDPTQGNIAGTVNAMNTYGGIGGPATTNMGNMATYGGVGGYPTDQMSLMSQYGGQGNTGTMMSNIEQYGGTGGPGSTAMGNLMSQGYTGGGAGINQMAQAGSAGSWGTPLNNMTAGNVGPVSNFATQGGMNSLQGIINGQGNPINQMPAWNAMVAAEQRPIQEGATNLAEQFNSSDNRFSSVFGQAATDYQNQAQLGLTQQLTSATAQAQQAAQNNLLSASGTLGGLGAQAANQQSNLMYGAGSQLAGYGAQGVNALNQNSVYGAGNVYGTQNNAANMMYGTANNALGSMYGTQNNAAQNMYGAQNAYNTANMGYSQGMLGLGQNAASGYNNMLNQNLSLGSGLGQQNYNNQQSAINNQYQNFQATLPQNNPLLQYMYGGSTGYTQNQQSSPGIMGAIGGILGAVPGLVKLSDQRLKEDIQPIGKVGKVNLYSYRFKGLSGRQVGPMAQEVYEAYPEAAIPGDESTPWMIRPNVLLEALARSN